jgi:microcystin degradation protein MlrC
MRIAIASFTHESNTFAAFPTTLAEFSVHRGEEVLRHYASTFHEVAGFIAAAEEFDYDLAPLLAANATPAGPLTSETYETLVGELLASIRSAGEIDGLLLALHGAMVAEEFPQADGETLRRVRELVGPHLPVVVTHDYHGNVPDSLVQDATALVIYKTNPHIDQRERGIQAAEILARAIRGDVKPTMAMAKPELLFNIAFHNTSKPPMQPLVQAAIALEKEPGILACSIAAGYQYADVPYMGPSIVVVTDNDPERAQREADRLAEMMWGVREDLIPNLPDAAEAVRMAMESSETPVALFELGDNIGGGSAGDATIILAELLRQRATGWVAAVFDPEAVGQCIAAGIGGEVALTVGGKTDDAHGAPVAIQGKVRTLSDGSYEERERRHGGARFINQGLSAVVSVVGKDGDRVGLLLLNSRRTTPFSIHQLTSVGIVPEQQRILVAKGAVAPRAAYEPVSARIIEVDTAGACAISRGPEAYRLARKSFHEWKG